MPAPQLSLAALATPKGLLLAGVPIVGIVALLNHKGAKPAVVTGAVTNANDTAIGTGQLADFENALLHAISYQPPAADTGSPSAPTAQPPTTPTPPTQPVAATTPPAIPPAAPSVQQAYGTGFVNSYEGTGAPWAPPPAAGSIAAPAGGTLLYGDFENGVLVSGTYALASGGTTTVGK